MFEKFRRKSALARLQEEKLYEQVLLELSTGHKRNGLWAKAIADCNGAEEKAESLYIRYRVQSMKDEIEITKEITEDVAPRRNSGEAPEKKKTIALEKPTMSLENESRLSHADRRKEPPAFYSYKDVIIKHNFITYWVGARSFGSAKEAESFIDSKV